MTDRVKYLLDETKLPTTWYNLAADLPVPCPPPLHPGTLQPLGPDDLAPLFPMALIQQEVSTEREIEIPGRCATSTANGVRRRCSAPAASSRPCRRRRASTTSTRASARPAATSRTPRSRRPSTTAKQASARSPPRPAPASGAHRSRLPAALFGIEVQVFMVRVSYDQKPYRRALMETYGARCVPSPSPLNRYGRDVLARDPECKGSLGMAISEAVEVAAPARRHQLRARIGAQPRAAAPDGHRHGGDRAVRSWPTTIRT